PGDDRPTSRTLSDAVQRRLPTRVPEERRLIGENRVSKGILRSTRKPRLHVERVRVARERAADRNAARNDRDQRHEQSQLLHALPFLTARAPHPSDDLSTLSEPTACVKCSRRTLTGHEADHTFEDEPSSAWSVGHWRWTARPDTNGSRLFIAFR